MYGQFAMRFKIEKSVLMLDTFYSVVQKSVVGLVMGIMYNWHFAI